MAWTSRPEPEWDLAERSIALAVHEIRQNTCPGCGGWLPETITDLPPDEDQPDHGMSCVDVWCRGCRAKAIHEQRHRKVDEKLEGTPYDEAPGRKVITRRVELPPPD